MGIECKARLPPFHLINNGGICSYSIENMWRRGGGSEEVGSSMTSGVLQSGVKSRKLHNPNQSYYTLKFYG